MPVRQLRQVVDELRQLDSLFDTLGRIRIAAPRDVLLERRREEERLLRHERDGAMQLLERNLAHVVAVDRDAALLARRTRGR